ncbi:hypothetical protein GA0111570_101179 [Raineyella antarctica]|uniref:N,N-dimethylformamidase beta subunit-like C-terminal domain-containing protein n=1 Tax=Raineyella antarctica TaxID=1577474 RepID=A0A1G6GD39_9ACTN|nr:N,N-dimethylformamidase beta subunit family domain-containing protein [Raineyella antarctica]SDB79907.1 hypothetical protein GA0111570_101179 [Raineyella antarctica]
MASTFAARRFAAVAVVFLLLLSACSANRSPSTGPGSSTGTTPSSPSGPWTVAENAKPGTSDWRIPDNQLSTDAQLCGYADRSSVLPGENFGLYVTSTLGDVTVAAYRVGSYGGAGGRLVWQSQAFPGVKQPDPVIEADHMVVAKWAKSLDVPTADWPEGSYLLKLTASGKSRYVPITVRSRSTAGKLVLVEAVTTDQAYNTWGGYSLYTGPNNTRAARVSFDRPQKGNGAQQFFGDRLAPTQLAESLGLDLAYVTSVDLDREPDLLAGASGLVSMGHDEYWTVGMRRSVEKARDTGTSLAFLGANAVYWRIRLKDGLTGDRRVVVEYRDAGADPKHDAVDTTVKFRSRPMPDPENSLTGMLYECFPAYGAMVVQDPTFPLFAGTGVKKGDRIPGVVGIEIDRAYPIPGTPASLTVVAHSPVTCGTSKQTFSDMTYYNAGTSGVWATGSMMWVKVLNGPNAKYGITDASVSFVKRVTTNAFVQMAKGNGQGGLSTTPNLAQLGASTSTATGTGGPVEK